MAQGEAVINTKKDFTNVIAWATNDEVWQWRIDKLKSDVPALQFAGIKPGVLIDSTGVHKNIRIVESKPYSELREK